MLKKNLIGTKKICPQSKIKTDNLDNGNKYIRSNNLNNNSSNGKTNGNDRQAHQTKNINSQATVDPIDDPT